MMLKNLVKYGLLNFIYFTYHIYFVKRKNRNKKIILEYGCQVKNTELGIRTYVGSQTILRNSVLGDYSYVNSGSRIRDTVIGKFCSIGPGVKIVLGSHPINFVSTHPIFYANNKPFSTFSNQMLFDEFKPVFIGNDVWIGEDVIIPGGVKIGDGAVILSRSVVTKDVEPFAVVGGVPAKVIKMRFNEIQIKELMNIKWWDKEEDWLKSNQKYFQNIELFLKEFTF